MNLHKYTLSQQGIRIKYMSYTSLAALQKHMIDFQLLESTYRESTEHVVNFGVNYKRYHLAIKIT